METSQVDVGQAYAPLKLTANVMISGGVMICAAPLGAAEYRP